jgi:hypothetical protein
MAKLYVALIDDGRDDTLHIYSCDTTSDPTTEGNWSSEDTYVFDGPIKSVWMFQQSSDLHISVAGINERDDFGWVKYVKFDPGTTEFVQLDATNNYYDEQVDNNDAHFVGEDAYGDVTVTTLVVRSDGDVLVFYEEDTTAPYYSRRELGSWTRGVMVSATSGMGGMVACLGASDRTHLFFHDNGITNLYVRSLSSANVLGSSTPEIDADVPATRHTIAGAVAFNDGTARIRVIYEDANNQLSAAYSNDQENWSGTAETNASDNDVAKNNESVIADVALDGDDTWLLYADVTDNDIYSDSNDGVGGWGSDNEEKDGVTCNGISCNVYTRGGDLKLGYIWDNNSTIAFDEKDLMPTAPGFADAELPEQNYLLGPFSV